MDDHSEDLQALGSHAYLRSIAEAREDHREGRVTCLEHFLDGTRRQPGGWEGRVEISDDFDDPLPDFLLNAWDGWM